MRLRALVALGLASLGFVLLSSVGSATAAPRSAPIAYPITTCATLSVSTENPNPGQAITVTGTHFLPNSAVKLVLRKSLNSTPSYSLGTFTTDSSGAFSASVTMPDAITNGGHYNIYALSGVGPHSNSCPADPYQTLALAAASTSTAAGGSTGGSTGGGTANTGLDIAALLVLAGGLVGAGVVINRRGRSKAARV